MDKEKVVDYSLTKDIDDYHSEGKDVNSVIVYDTFSSPYRRIPAG